MHLRNTTLIRLITFSVVFLPLTPASAIVPPGVGTETIVMIRHGEKPEPNPHGQLNCQGLNRSLALPAVLARFGHPAAIFAPNPSIQTSEGSIFGGPKYSYIRPLATIEPYAIVQNMPVNVQIGANDIQALQQEVLKPAYANALVVIAWEHIRARQFAEQMLKTFGEADVVPGWPNSDYETIYIFRISTTTDGKRTLVFSIEHENLKDLPRTCPGVSPPAPPTPEKSPSASPVPLVPPPA